MEWLRSTGKPTYEGSDFCRLFELRSGASGLGRSRRSISFTKSIGSCTFGFLTEANAQTGSTFGRGCHCGACTMLPTRERRLFVGVCRFLLLCFLRKAASEAEKQTRFLPVILPMRDLLGSAWCEHVVEARQSMGLESIPEREEQDREERFILFPSQRSWLDFRWDVWACRDDVWVPCQGPSERAFSTLYSTLSDVHDFWRTQTSLDFPWNRMSFVMTMLEGVRTGTFVPLSARDSHFVSKTMAVPIISNLQRVWNLPGRQWQNAFQVSLWTMAMQLSQNDFTVKLQEITAVGQLTNHVKGMGPFPRTMSVLKDRATLMVEGGKISQRYFFTEIVPPHIHESSSKGHQESDSWAWIIGWSLSALSAGEDAQSVWNLFLCGQWSGSFARHFNEFSPKDAQISEQICSY